MILCYPVKTDAKKIFFAKTLRRQAARNEILDRPRNETPFLLLVAGYPRQDAEAPDIEKLPFDTVVRYMG